MVKSRKFCCLLVILMLAGPMFLAVPAEAVETVTVEGVAMVRNGETLARDEALEDAQRRAVEKAAGVHIQSSTLMEDMQVIEHEVLAQADGFVESFDVLNEWREGDRYIVEIRATVSERLRDELADMGFILQEQLGNPRVMIMVEEENLDESSMFSVFGSELRSLLVEAGFNLVNPDVAEDIREREETKKMLEGDFEAAVALGEAYDADIVVHGRTFTDFITERDAGSSTLYSMNAYADVQATTTQDANIIASLHEEEAHYAPSKKLAGNEALQQLANDVKLDLARDIIAGINRAGGAHSMTVVALDVSTFGDVNDVENTLETTRGVERVDFRSFDNQVAEFDIEISMSPENLASFLSEEPNLSVTQLQSHRMELRMD